MEKDKEPNKVYKILGVARQDESDASLKLRITRENTKDASATVVCSSGATISVWI
jgi:hypothetical protein